MKRALLTSALLFACGSRTQPIQPQDAVPTPTAVEADAAVAAPATRARPRPVQNLEASTDLEAYVLLRFEPTDQATSYRVLRDGSVIAELGPGSTRYADIDADPGELGAPSALMASQGSSAEGVELSWSAPTASLPGTLHGYTIVSVVDDSFSAPSNEAWGQRSPAPLLHYELSRDGERSWQTLGSETRHFDREAPEGELAPGRARSEALLLPDRFVRLSLPDATLREARVHYRVRALSRDGPSASSPSASGHRKLPPLRYQWQRSSGERDADYTDLLNGSGPSWFDHALTANTTRYYRAQVSAGDLHALSLPAETRALPKVRQAPQGQMLCTLFEDDTLYCEHSRRTPVGWVPGRYRQITGDYNLCALQRDGRRVCWGRDDFGTAPPGLSITTYAEIGSRRGPLCMLRESDRGVECSGTFSSYEENFPPNERFLHLSVGDKNVCGLTLDSSLLCWGPHPVGPSAPSAIKYRSVYNEFWYWVCAVQSDGVLTCWTYQNAQPHELAGAEGLRFREVENRVALSEDGRLFALGGPYAPTSITPIHPERRYERLSNGCGIRADGHFDCRSDPFLPFAEPLQSVLGLGPLCVLKADGAPACIWPLPFELPVARAPEVRAIGYARGICVLFTDGTLRCENLGDPRQFPGLPDDLYTALAYNTEALCGLTRDGRVRCALQGTPTQPDPVFSGRYTQLLYGQNHVCALRSDGVPECFGSELAGQVPPAARDVRTLALGAKHTCALRSDGQVLCWGDNQFEQAPRGPREAGDLIDLVAASNQTCGLSRDGGVHCWGNSTLSTPSLGRYKELHAGRDLVCGVRDDQKLVCWGNTGAYPGDYTGLDGRPLIAP